MLLPILKMFLSSTVLFTYYVLLLRNKSCHQYNRFFLLFIVAVSISLPFVSIPLPALIEQPQSQKVYKVFQLVSDEAIDEAENVVTNADAAMFFDLRTLMLTIYIGVALFSFLAVMRSWFYIRRLRKRSWVEQLNGVEIYHTNEPSAPFSFLQSIFWNDRIVLDSKEGRQVLQHEMVHLEQRHSFDNLFLELVTALAWFNPVFHLIKKEVKTVHEFLADHDAARADKLEYAETLVLQSIAITNRQLVHPFFNNHLKRRIFMLSNQPNQRHLAGRILSFFAVAAVFCLFSFHDKAGTQIAKPLDKTVSVVIDAGHGGIDPGVKMGNSSEAQINLEIASEIATIGKEYNVDVIMTRMRDELPGGAPDIKTGLQNRADLTNASKPIGFISIHMDAATEKDVRNGKGKTSGISAYISGRRKDPASEAFAQDLLASLSGVYSADTMYRKRNASGIWVLDKTNCPAVLLECGYITNTEDFAFMSKKENQRLIARQIVEGILRFAKSNPTVSQNK